MDTILERAPLRSLERPNAERSVPSAVGFLPRIHQSRRARQLRRTRCTFLCLCAPIIDNQSCRKLIQLYGTKELLWNSKSSSYHNKSLREDAWREISSEMGVPVPELKRKMENI
ncbi:hypothetical protein B5X24_HaOG214007 [Helicoverpa armigera]|nr:hypothetical protein B5X24_HaOG214007 [Helicoverpa armigera]